VAERTADDHVNDVLRLTISRSLLLVSVRKDHELDRFLLEKQKQKAPEKKPKRGSAEDPFCHLFGYYVVVIGDNGPEDVCRFRKTNPCPCCGRTNDSK
jgi:hypothetical protein